MKSDLVRRAIVDAQRMGTASDIKAWCLPVKGLLENAMAEIAREEKAVVSARGQCGKKPRLGDTRILSLVDDCECIGANTFFGHGFGQSPEVIGPSDSATIR